jgi:hypothetical protein
MKATLKKHRILFLVLIAVIGLTVLFTVNYIRINRACPNPTLETYQLNQPVSVKNFSIAATKFQLMDAETAIKQYKIDDDEINKVLRMYPTRIALITITVKNNDKSEQTLSAALHACTTMSIQSFTFANGIADDLRFIFNSNDSYKPKLKSGEQTTFVLPFTMIESQFKKGNWANINSRKFDLVLTNYPVKKSIHVN